MTFVGNKPRTRAPLDESGRSRLEELLRRKTLQGYDRGALAALARRGTEHDMERATAKLAATRPTRPGQPKQKRTSLLDPDVTIEI
jgi:hypothetical protein